MHAHTLPVLRTACFVAWALVFSASAADAQTRQTSTATTTTLSTETRTPSEVARTMRRAGSSATETLRVLAVELRADTRTATRALREAGYNAPQMIEGFFGNRAHYGPGSTHGGHPVTELVSAGEPIEAVSSAAVRTYALTAMQLAAELKAAGATASAIAAGLAAGGYSVRIIAQTLKGMGIVANDMAVALADQGLTLAQVGDELLAVGFTLDETAIALTKRFGALTGPIAVWMKATGIAANLAGHALRGAGISAVAAAGALRQAGYEVSGIGAGLVEYGASVEATAAALHEAGASPNELAEFLRDRGRTASQAGSILAQQLALPLQAVIAASMHAFSLSLENSFAAVAIHYAFEKQAAALHHLGVKADQAAAWLKKTGAKAGDVFDALKQHWQVTNVVATKALRTAGYTAAVVATDLHEKQSGMMLTMMTLMQMMMSAGFGGNEIASAVAPLYNVSVDAALATIATLTP